MSKKKEMKIPTGVKVIGVLLFILGLLLALLSFLTVLDEFWRPPFFTETSTLTVIFINIFPISFLLFISGLGILNFLISGLLITSGYNLLKGKSWARKIAIIYCIIMLLFLIMWGFGGGSDINNEIERNILRYHPNTPITFSTIIHTKAFIHLLINILYSVIMALIVYYLLFNKKVKEMFKK